MERESPVDDLEANTWELQLPLAKMRAVDWRTPGLKACENTQYEKGWRSIECRARVLSETVPGTMWPATAVERLLDARAEMVKEHDAKRQRRENEPMQQEPSSSSGHKGATKRASATSVQELEESLYRAGTWTSRSAGALMVAAEGRDS